MIASNMVERIYPICAQTKPKVPYLSTDVLIAHSIDSPLVLSIGGVPHHCIFFTLFAMLAQQLGWLCICKQPMHPRSYREIPNDIYGPSLVLIPSFDGSCLYRGALHLGHASKSLYLSPRYNMQSLEHAWIFSTLRPLGRSFVWLGMSFSVNLFF
jgi:hypothetical protein